MTNYKFTKDWFSWAPEVWTQLIPMLPGEPGDRHFLEVGSFEGRSTIWIAENMMQDGDVLDCIDTWKGGEEHVEEHMEEAEQRFDYNRSIALTGRAIEIEKIKGSSVYGLSCLLTGVDSDENQPYYSFIYIDGSHIAKDVLTDACMAWPLLKPKGLMVFDDYMWGNPRDILHRPKPAIDAFCNLFAEEAEIIHVGYQLVVRKKGE
jgi:predicted O-methyltransferase YrrM